MTTTESDEKAAEAWIDTETEKAYKCCEHCGASYRERIKNPGHAKASFLSGCAHVRAEQLNLDAISSMQNERANHFQEKLMEAHLQIQSLVALVKEQREVMEGYLAMPLPLDKMPRMTIEDALKLFAERILMARSHLSKPYPESIRQLFEGEK